MARSTAQQLQARKVAQMGMRVRVVAAPWACYTQNHNRAVGMRSGEEDFCVE